MEDILSYAQKLKPCFSLPLEFKHRLWKLKVCQMLKGMFCITK